MSSPPLTQSLYIPADQWWHLFGTVTPAGDLDEGHQAAWAVDGKPGIPIRLNATSGSFGLTKAVDNAVAGVNVLALAHSNFREGLVATITGDLSGSIVMPAWGRNKVPYTPYTLIDEAAASAIDVALATNDVDLILGEFLAGRALALPDSIRVEGSQFANPAYFEALANPLVSVPAYSDHARGRIARGTQYYDQAGLDAILDWYDSQDAEAYRIPSALILNPADALDFRLGFLSEPTFSQVEPDPPRYLVSIEFVELPRPQWYNVG